jgi:hypothetical protein
MSSILGKGVLKCCHCELLRMACLLCILIMLQSVMTGCFTICLVSSCCLIVAVQSTVVLRGGFFQVLPRSSGLGDSVLEQSRRQAL